MVLSLLEEMLAPDGRSISSAVDGAAFTFAASALRRAGLDWNDVPTEVSDSLQEPVFAATRAGLELGRGIAEKEAPLTTFDSLGFADHGVELSRYRR
jgi:hypothetical protein